LFYKKIKLLSREELFLAKNAPSRLSAGLHQDPVGKIQCSPTTLAGYKAPTSKTGEKVKGWEGMGQSRGGEGGRGRQGEGRGRDLPDQCEIAS